jgi:hypothetical protein
MIKLLKSENYDLTQELLNIRPNMKRAEQQLGLEKDLALNLNEKIAKLT